MKAEVVVIGGGPAGLAAALKASEHADVMLLEREDELGGILPQCIHDGFGNFIFNEMMTGPEYAQHFIDGVKKSDIDVRLETAVLEIGMDRKIVATNPAGIMEIEARAIVLAMGCRERTRNQILIPGTRPAGIYTAGTAQRLINIEGVMPGRKIVMLGSGDVGLIMARRFALEGAEVEGVYELLPKPGGLTRNIVQCLDDYDIPLHLSHTITDIKGKERVEGVTIARVDESMSPIKETERFIPCDCLILAVGLIPENELSKQVGIAIDKRTGGPFVDEHMETSVPGIFACGNVAHVHDLVDDVTLASEIAGTYAGKYAAGKIEEAGRVNITAGKNVRYVVPQFLRGLDMDSITFYFRVKEESEDVNIVISDGDRIIFEKREMVVKPPEMVKVVMPSSLLANTGGEVRIDVEGKYEK